MLMLTFKTYFKFVDSTNFHLRSTYQFKLLIFKELMLIFKI